MTITFKSILELALIDLNRLVGDNSGDSYEHVNIILT